MLKLLPTATVAALAVGLLAATSLAADAPIDRNLDFGFGASKPGAPTAMRFHVEQRPTPAGQQAPPVRKASLLFPAGTKVDPSAVTPCTATVAGVQSGGLKACPAASKLGGGKVGLFLGASSPTEVATVFARKGGILLVISSSTGAVLRAVPGTLHGTRLDLVLPRVKIGDFEAALTFVSLTIPKHGTARRPFLRTPATCPKTRAWTFTYRPTFDPPHGTETLTDKTRCTA